mmetsp:Transcript_10562/g.29618  ORF Transcript_10562/g.29618 Transcript_10562/m.29618 type:complete len:288 (-) Transcript_10562:998-1861(-)
MKVAKQGNSWILSVAILKVIVGRAPRALRDIRQEVAVRMAENDTGYAHVPHQVLIHNFAVARFHHRTFDEVSKERRKEGANIQITRPALPHDVHHTLQDTLPLDEVGEELVVLTQTADGGDSCVGHRRLVLEEQPQKVRVGNLDAVLETGWDSVDPVAEALRTGRHLHPDARLVVLPQTHPHRLLQVLYFVEHRQERVRVPRHAPRYERQRVRHDLAVTPIRVAQRAEIVHNAQQRAQEGGKVDVPRHLPRHLFADVVAEEVGEVGLLQGIAAAPAAAAAERLAAPA